MTTERKGKTDGGEPVLDGAAGLEAWARQQKVMLTTISAWGEEAAKFYQKRLAAQAELLNALRDVHGPTQWVEVQARFTRDMAEDYVSEAQALMAIGQQAVAPQGEAQARDQG